MEPVKSHVIKITVPDYATSREDEIEIIQKLVDNFNQTQSYLSSLFTPELLAHVSAEIRSDMAPDICAELIHAGRELKDADERNKMLQDEISRLNDCADEARVVRETAFRNRMIEVEKHNQEMGEVQDAKWKAEQALSDTLQELVQTKDSLAAREQDILALKARLYDFMSQEAK